MIEDTEFDVEYIPAEHSLHGYKCMACRVRMEYSDDGLLLADVHPVKGRLHYTSNIRLCTSCALALSKVIDEKIKSTMTAHELAKVNRDLDKYIHYVGT